MMIIVYLESNCERSGKELPNLTVKKLRKQWSAVRENLTKCEEREQGKFRQFLRTADCVLISWLLNWKKVLNKKISDFEARIKERSVKNQGHGLKFETMVLIGMLQTSLLGAHTVNIRVSKVNLTNWEKH